MAVLANRSEGKRRKKREKRRLPNLSLFLHTLREGKGKGKERGRGKGRGDACWCRDHPFPVTGKGRGEKGGRKEGEGGGLRSGPIVIVFDYGKRRGGEKKGGREGQDAPRIPSGEIREKKKKKVRECRRPFPCLVLEPFLLLREEGKSALLVPFNEKRKRRKGEKKRKERKGKEGKKTFFYPSVQSFSLPGRREKKKKEFAALIVHRYRLQFLSRVQKGKKKEKKGKKTRKKKNPHPTRA